MKKLLTATALLLAAGLSYAQTVIDNGVVRRVIGTSDGHIVSSGYSLTSSETNFTREGSREFSFLVNDRLYTGLDEWSGITSRDTTASNGMKGVIISFFEPGGAFKAELTYLTYPGLPLVRKFLRVTNLADSELKLEGVFVEDFNPGLNVTPSYTKRNYGRDKVLGPYKGNWDDPLVVLCDQHNHGIAVGNESVGIIKRTDTFAEGRYIRAGVTQPGDDYPFRRWLDKGESWRSAGIFTVPWEGTNDSDLVVNTAVQTYLHKYIGARIEEIPHKPLFVYNTWVPFYRNINADMIKEIAEAAAECGVEEFIIDDGWQTNVGSSSSKDDGTVKEDWAINTERFPGGLKPVFDHIKSLGMKPGLWLSVGRLDRNNRSVVEHPEWFIVGPDGQLTDLHTGSGSNLSACMGTDWCDYIKETILGYVREYGLMYAKLDLSIVTSAYVYDPDHTGCYAENHPYHKDHEESYDVIYERCMQLFDDLHKEAPELFIDCTFETAGKLQLMDYGITLHAEGNWLSNVEEPSPYGPMRVRNLAWGRTPALHPTSLVVGNLRMDDEMHLLNWKSLTGTLPIMLGDPRSLTKEEREEFKAWTGWLKGLEERHGIMSFRQDLPDFGEPREGCWDGFCRLNTETCSGGLIGVFRQGAADDRRIVTVPWLDDARSYVVRKGVSGKKVFSGTGEQLRTKGFTVRFDKLYDGELFEVSEK